jgi:hypothetical protein
MHEKRLAEPPAIEIALTKHRNSPMPERQASCFRFPGGDVSGIAQVIRCKEYHDDNGIGDVPSPPRKFKSIVVEEHH